MATKLYPPQIEGTLPAFYITYDVNNVYKEGATIVVPFSMNQAVSENLIGGFALRLKTIQSGKQLFTEYIKCSAYDLDEFKVTFELTQTQAEELTEGLYYKAQIAYLDTDGETPGYYSTVGVIKCTSKPDVYINDLTYGSLNLFTNEYIGVYDQTSCIDQSEKVYSYRFDFYDDNDDLYYSTGDIIHNCSDDTDYESSTDKVVINTFDDEASTYSIQYVVTTTNGMEIKSKKYSLTSENFVAATKAFDIIPSVNYYGGYISINFKGQTKIVNDIETGDNKEVEENYYGTYILTRASQEDNYSTWFTIYKFRLDGECPSSVTVLDFTAQQGIYYKYSLQQYSLWGIFSDRIISDPIYSSFEDSFLYDGERFLRIRFNPKMNTFKNDVLEQKIDTIGSKYPFIFRNGDTFYKEFQLGGLIASDMDEEELFLVKGFKNFRRVRTLVDPQYMGINEYVDREKDPEKYDQLIAGLEFAVSQMKDLLETRDENEAEYFRYPQNPSDINISLERRFKLEVLDWLNDGKPKIFKSPTEGCYIIRLLNISLTPEDTLGRAFHNFTSTAYEIADYTYENLVKYGFIKIPTLTTYVPLWKTFELDDYPAGQDIVLEFPFNLMSFVAQDMFPGDVIRVKYLDTDATQDFYIGTTGSYTFINNSKTVEKITIPGKTNQRNIGFITCYYRGQRITKFDAITNIGLKTIVGKQFVGENAWMGFLWDHLENDWSNEKSIFYLPEWWELRKTKLLSVVLDYLEETTGTDTTLANIMHDVNVKYEVKKALAPYEAGDVCNFITFAMDGNSTKKLELLNIEQGKFRLREKIPIYYNKEDNAIPNKTNQYYPCYNKYVAKKTGTNNISTGFNRWQLNPNASFSATPWGDAYPIEQLRKINNFPEYCIYEVFDATLNTVSDIDYFGDTIEFYNHIAPGINNELEDYIYCDSYYDNIMIDHYDTTFWVSRDKDDYVPITIYQDTVIVEVDTYDEDDNIIKKNVEKDHYYYLTELRYTEFDINNVYEYDSEKKQFSLASSTRYDKNLELITDDNIPGYDNTYYIYQPYKYEYKKISQEDLNNKQYYKYGETKPTIYHTYDTYTYNAITGRYTLNKDSYIVPIPAASGGGYTTPPSDETQYIQDGIDYYYLYTYIEQEVDLSTIKEYDIKDFGDADKLIIGSGVIAELVFQIKILDYYTEIYEEEVAAAKEKYLEKAELYRNLYRTYEDLTEADANYALGDMMIQMYQRLLEGNDLNYLPDEYKIQWYDFLYDISLTDNLYLKQIGYDYLIQNEIPFDSDDGTATYKDDTLLAAGIKVIDFDSYDYNSTNVSKYYLGYFYETEKQNIHEIPAMTEILQDKDYYGIESRQEKITDEVIPSTTEIITTLENKIETECNDYNELLLTLQDSVTEYNTFLMNKKVYEWLNNLVNGSIRQYYNTTYDTSANGYIIELDDNNNYSISTSTGSATKQSLDDIYEHYNKEISTYVSITDKYYGAVMNQVDSYAKNIDTINNILDKLGLTDQIVNDKEDNDELDEYLNSLLLDDKAKLVIAVSQIKDIIYNNDRYIKKLLELQKENNDYNNYFIRQHEEEDDLSKRKTYFYFNISKTYNAATGNYTYVITPETTNKDIFGYPYNIYATNTVSGDSVTLETNYYSYYNDTEVDTSEVALIDYEQYVDENFVQPYIKDFGSEIYSNYFLEELNNITVDIDTINKKIENRGSEYLSSVEYQNNMLNVALEYDYLNYYYRYLTELVSYNLEEDEIESYEQITGIVKTYVNKLKTKYLQDYKDDRIGYDLTNSFENKSNSTGYTKDPKWYYDKDFENDGNINENQASTIELLTNIVKEYCDNIDDEDLTEEEVKTDIQDKIDDFYNYDNLVTYIAKINENIAAINDFVRDRENIIKKDRTIEYEKELCDSVSEELLNSDGEFNTKGKTYFNTTNDLFVDYPKITASTNDIFEEIFYSLDDTHLNLLGSIALNKTTDIAVPEGLGVMLVYLYTLLYGQLQENLIILEQAEEMQLLYEDYISDYKKKYNIYKESYDNAKSIIDKYSSADIDTVEGQSYYFYRNAEDKEAMYKSYYNEMMDAWYEFVILLDEKYTEEIEKGFYK